VQVLLEFALIICDVRFAIQPSISEVEHEIRTTLFNSFGYRIALVLRTKLPALTIDVLILTFFVNFIETDCQWLPAEPQR
jgi:hypothetical protein